MNRLHRGGLAQELEERCPEDAGRDGGIIGFE